ncbi:MAG: DUF3313 family protein [Verrucomicrobiota bacterium]
MKLVPIAPFSASVLIALAFTSCGLEEAAKSPEATRFLTSTGVNTYSKIERLPFEYAWRDPKMKISDYKYIVVRPVTTAFLKKDHWEQSKSEFVPDEKTYKKRCTELARYFSKSLNKAFSDPICVFYKTTSTSQPGTLILEVALTEVRFDSEAPVVPAGPAEGNVTGLLTGLPICSFEARVTDAATGAVVTTASDRRVPEIKVIDPEARTGAAPNERICDEWAKQLMESANIEIFPTVKRSWFSLF